MTERAVVSLMLFVGVAVASAVGIGWYRRWALRRNLVDVPNERSSHQVPTPRGAGLLVALLTLIAWGLLLGAGTWPLPRGGLGLMAGATLLSAVGFVDDLKAVSRAYRLAAQVVAALVLVISCIPVERISLGLPLVGVVALGPIAWPLLVLWVVGLTNAYNFMDGIDGMAGLQATVAGLAWFWLGSRFGMPAHAGLGLLLAASAVGFSFHNLPKARVFLGDAGSTFFGFVFAALSVIAAVDNPGSPLFAGTALFLWPLIFDTAFTLLRRWRARARLLEPHREHLYQRLQQAGFSHLQVAALYAGLSLLGVGCGFLLQFRSALFDAVALASLASLAFLLWSLIRRAEQSRAAAGAA